MPKVTDDYRRARRLEISQAALRCFARKGFQATSMADIIAESGLSAGAIYGNFKNKDELIARAVREVLEDQLFTMDQMHDDGRVPPPREIMTRFISGVTRGLEDLGLIVQIWAESTTDPGLRVAAESAAVGLRSMFEDYALAWLTRPEAEGVPEPEVRARQYGSVMLGLCQGFIVQSTLVGDFDADSYLAGLDALQLP